jgi:hypothetical protein
MKKLSKLKIYYSEYQVVDIEDMIAVSPGIDNFVFSSYYSGSENSEFAPQLIAYAHITDGGGSSYNPDYDVLSVHDHKHAEVSCPAMLCNNFITLQNMLKLINTEDSHGHKPDYLVFVPEINAATQVYYNIKLYKKKEGKDVQIPLPPKGNDDPSITNPSPPATIIGK